MIRHPDDSLARARRGSRRLAFAGLLLVLCGVAMVLVGLLVVPFFFPFALVAGAGVMLVGWRVRRRLGPTLGVIAAGASVAAGLAVVTAGGVAVVLGALLVAAGCGTLAIVFVDAGRFISRDGSHGG